MSLFLHFFFGFTTSFLGMVFPSLLNMTTVKISLERGSRKATSFAIGVSIMVIFQAYLAIGLSEYLMQHPDIIAFIQGFASLIFAGLALYFFFSFKKEKQPVKILKKDCRNTFLIGLLLSAVNMFAIPFYYGITITLGSLGLFTLSSGPIFLFVVGSALGSFVILQIYPLFVAKLKQKSKPKKYSINLILSVLTGVFSLITLFNFL